jgi:excisionase family DNA binding protein
MEKKYMTIDEVAQYLAIWPMTIYRWVIKRSIPFIEVGDSIRFHVDEVDYLRRRRFN